MNLLFKLIEQLSAATNNQANLCLNDEGGYYKISFFYQIKGSKHYMQYCLYKSDLIRCKKTTYNNFYKFMENEIKKLPNG